MNHMNTKMQRDQSDVLDTQTTNTSPQKKLKASDEKYLLVFLKNPDPIIITSIDDFLYVDVNDAFLAIFGYARQDVVGRSVLDLKTAVLEQYHSILNKLKSNGFVSRGEEIQARARSGEIMTFILSTDIIFFDDEPRILWTAKDISAMKNFEEALRVSEEKFFKVYNYSPDATILVELDSGQYVEVNDAFVQLMGYERHEIIGPAVEGINIWVDIEERDAMLRKAMEKGKINNLETRFRAKNGDVFICLFSAEVLEIGGRRYLLSVTKDITGRKKIEEELRLSEDKFSKAFESSLISMTITRLSDGMFLAANKAVCRQLGYEKEEIVNRTSLDINFWVNIDDRAEVAKKIKAKEPVKEMEILYRNRSGEVRIGSYSAERINLNGEPCTLSMMIDISDRKRSEEQVRYLSYHDKLTGLYNRAYFEEQLQRMATSRQMPVSLIMGDVNGLKLVNDALGHQEGDNLLIDVAEIIRKFCRQDDIIARWGGDEFIILMPNCSSQNAAGILERIRTACQQLNNRPIKSSIALGQATMGSTSQDLGDIIKEAEDKMYRNKLLDDRSNRSSFLVSLEQTLWSRSTETEEHCRRLQEMARIIGSAVKLSDSELDDLKLLSLLHDIGKIAIPNSILEKPGKLSREEWENIKKHPEIGYRIALSSPEMAPIAEGILHHHERWDGSGYPLGIKGEEIPLLSRIVAIADAFDVMVCGRPYQQSISSSEAWEEIERCAGSQFDPHLVSVSKHLF